MTAMFVVLCLVQVLVALEFSIINVALPTVQSEFSVPVDDLQWLLSAYAIAFASGLLVGGRLADRIGLRRALIASLIVFTCAACMAGSAHTFGLLLSARILQGLAAAVAAPAALALLTKNSTGGRQRRALAYWGAASSFGFALGVVTGGVVTEVFGWRSVFWTCAGMSFVSLIGVLVVVPARRLTQTPRFSVDLAGVFLLAATTGAVITVVVMIGSGAHHMTSLLGLAAAGVTGVIAFFVHQRTSPQPVFPAGFVRCPQIWKANAVGALATAAGGSMVYFVSDYLQTTLHWPQLWVGLALIPDAIAAAGGARLASLSLAHWGGQRATQLGLIAIAGGMLILAILTGVPPLTITAILVGTSLVGFGLVHVAVVTTVRVSDRLSAEEHGLSAGLIMATQQWGVAIGLALLVSLSTSGAKFGDIIQTHSQLAFLGGSAMAAVGLAVTLALRRRTSRSMESSKPAAHKQEPIRRP